MTFAVLGLGLLLGMRHATEPDHLVAVSALVSRERTLRSAAPIGMVWGLGHTVTIFAVGTAIVVFGLVIPPVVALGLQLGVALMLVLLGSSNLLRLRNAEPRAPGGHASAAGHGRPFRSMRVALVGVMHGLEGSAALTLMVVGTLREPRWALAYLLVFGVGTIAGMLATTTLLALPIAVAAARFERAHRVLAVLTGVASVLFGLVLAYQASWAHDLSSLSPK
jgi:hypothetical protein